MSRYVDANEVKRQINRATIGRTDVIKVCLDLLHRIDRIPSADVVEVVRCKDCKYRHKEWYQDKRNKDGGYWIVGCGNDAIAERVYGLAQDNDFCSYGER